MKPEMIRKILEMEGRDFAEILESLGKNDYDVIQALTLELEEGMKNKRAHNKRKVMFGYWSALEVLAKLGIFFEENGVAK